MRTFRPLLLASLFALLTIAAGNAQAPAATPQLLSTTCTSDTDCPTGQKCCYPCGIDGCDFVCMTVTRNRCPFFP